ncbi:BTB/POZ domain-containing protein 6-like isoform X1 [Acropora millepora]|uniref:BTB/POZ domain-containing protein 6-like isoform X1 n=1 Tax=Acropora millepora TaxID=45264 RepID=UPI001CF5B22A|nr:BTB/POZ domain-containing protein 6-like isoform X1 [Acropora millepora]
MSSPETWQTKRSTIRERTKFMLNNDLFSDVKFVVRKSDSEGESESKKVIPAHKFVLSIGSPVFEAMFYGELAETRDSIELPDCEYESLLELFRYLYSDEVNLSGSNVMGVLYLAKKYIVPSLVDKCSQYLQDHLQPENVFNILAIAEKYEEKGLIDQCWEVIDNQSEEAVKSDGFTTIELCLLESIVSRDTLTINEIDLFKAVDLWATKKCEKQGLEANGEVKRRVLDETVVKAIRFPVMELRDFSAVVLNAKILNLDEVTRLVQFFTSSLATEVGFPATSRTGVSAKQIGTCCRFEKVDVVAWHPHGLSDFLVFSVNKEISLHGLCLYGRENSFYSVDLKIMNPVEMSPLVHTTGQFMSNIIDYGVSSYYGFEVYFDKPVRVKKNSRYEIEAKLSGSSSFCSGSSGLREVETSGVKFTFYDSTHLPTSNGTSVSNGQFPQLLFSF